MRKHTKKITNITSPFNNLKDIDYKEVYKLKKFVTTRGRILESSKTGLSQRYQKRLAKSIKRARYMALLPFNDYA